MASPNQRDAGRDFEGNGPSSFDERMPATTEAKKFPAHGAIVVFAKVPAGSYCSEGVRYRVERPTGRGAFRFVNVERGSSTYDQPYAVAVARWAESA